MCGGCLLRTDHAPPYHRPSARVAELVDAAGLKPATSRKGVYGFDSRPAHQHRRRLTERGKAHGAIAVARRTRGLRAHTHRRDGECCKCRSPASLNGNDRNLRRSDAQRGARFCALGFEPAVRVAPHWLAWLPLVSSDRQRAQPYREQPAPAKRRVPMCTATSTAISTASSGTAWPDPGLPGTVRRCQAEQHRTRVRICRPGRIHQLQNINRETLRAVGAIAAPR